MDRKQQRIDETARELHGAMYNLAQAQMRVKELQEKLDILRHGKRRDPVRKERNAIDEMFAERRALLGGDKKDPNVQKELDAINVAEEAKKRMQIEVDRKLAEFYQEEENRRLAEELPPPPPAAAQPAKQQPAKQQPAAQPARPQPAAQPARPQPAAQPARPQPAAQPAVDAALAAHLEEEERNAALVEHFRIQDLNNLAGIGDKHALAQYMNIPVNQVTDKMADDNYKFNKDVHAVRMAERREQCPQLPRDRDGSVLFPDGSKTHGGYRIIEPPGKKSFSNGPYCFLIALWYLNYDYFSRQRVQSPYALAEFLNFKKIPPPPGKMYEYRTIIGIAELLKVTIAVTIEDDPQKVYLVNAGKNDILGVTLNKHHYTNGLER